ncbi:MULTISPECIES: Flp family type IVb pilin [Rhizobium/Agrobacterium group]|jgi:pilus assembly protein Flp/PilA|uniref:Flp family type IVb pilin n=1 Tax=Rhizobium/Agrobacterium group TaxID=227290 RepID=UPI00129B3017|nr:MULTISPECIES: Flp family type IVb pilin [Rhizobium/Agrobacterium group]MBO9110581.1 Flp family type IVb pilin [Agrobacterium sp. S2/73]QXZ74505.1 Flp family type IVb pilin [Agrobacterium sp. S7/73]UZX43720.1 Flp family type IVb pilin [Agrobacterium sp. 13-2099-1-2]WCA71106.1 Flp family type IVb pilin [Agrobacterium tumefaciens]WCK20662.1 Flp family type IVb pilin [Agrobacterium tumefaciens]
MADGEYPVLHCFIRFFKDENGATAVEYGLIVGVISATIIGGGATIGSNINAVFQFLADTFANI